MNLYYKAMWTLFRKQPPLDYIEDEIMHDLLQHLFEISEQRKSKEDMRKLYDKFANVRGEIARKKYRLSTEQTEQIIESAKNKMEQHIRKVVTAFVPYEKMISL